MVSISTAFYMSLVQMMLGRVTKNEEAKENGINEK
jgi:hypothetical protein